MDNTECATDEYWMQQALIRAGIAESHGEIPVGAVVVLNNQIIGEGWNRSIMDNDPTAHAEILALKDAAKNIGNYRILNATLYVTLEPCMMCAGALIHSRVKKVVFGAQDNKTGAAGSFINLFQLPKLNHYIEVFGGVQRDECSTKISDFFVRRRLEIKQQKLLKLTE